MSWKKDKNICGRRVWLWGTEGPSLVGEIKGHKMRCCSASSISKHMDETKLLHLKLGCVGFHLSPTRRTHAPPSFVSHVSNTTHAMSSTSRHHQPLPLHRPYVSKTRWVSDRAMAADATPISFLSSPPPPPPLVSKGFDSCRDLKICPATLEDVSRCHKSTTKGLRGLSDVDTWNNRIHTRVLVYVDIFNLTVNVAY